VDAGDRVTGLTNECPNGVPDGSLRAGAMSNDTFIFDSFDCTQFHQACELPLNGPRAQLEEALDIPYMGCCVRAQEEEAENLGPGRGCSEEVDVVGPG